MEVTAPALDPREKRLHPQQITRHMVNTPTAFREDQRIYDQVGKIL
jgi:hypothetical protein